LRSSKDVWQIRRSSQVDCNFGIIVLANLEYLSILFCAVLWAAAPGLVAVLLMWDSAYVYGGTVTSRVIIIIACFSKRPRIRDDLARATGGER